MRFAVNYSTKLAELIKAGKLDCDLFKCPEWEGLLKAASSVKPVYLHLDINVGRGEVSQLNFEKLRKMLAETGSPHVNCHLSGTQNLKVGSKADRTKLLKLWIKEIEVLKKEFEGYPVISENLPFEPLIPNDETIEAMKAARRGELTTAGTPDRLLEKLNAGD